MSNDTKAKSAELILKLYELRREDKMREARNWMTMFSPESASDIMQAMVNADTTAYFRMVTSYWDMAASFVNHEAIDADMFNDAQGEHILVFSKVEPHLEELRTMLGNPRYMHNLETLIMKIPNAKEMMQKRREMMMRVRKMRESQQA